MPTYHVQTPDGKTLTLQGPAGATAEQAIARAKALHAGWSGPTEMSPLPKVSGLEAFLRGVTGGATANFDNKLAAAGDALYNGHTYQQNYGKQSVASQAATMQHPVASVAGGVLGNIAGLLGMGEAAKLAAPILEPIAAAGSKLLNLSPTVAKVAASPAGRAVLGGGGPGAAYGAASAAGAAPPGKELPAAAQGAVTGAIGGTALHGITAGAFPLIAKYWSVLAGKGANAEAFSQLQAALARDGYDVMSPNGAGTLKQALTQLSPKASLADLGPNVRNRAVVALNDTSAAQAPAADAINARSAGQGARLASEVKATVAPRTDVHTLAGALTDDQKAALETKNRALYNINDASLTPTTQGGVKGFITDQGKFLSPTDAGQYAADRDLLNVEKIGGVGTKDFALTPDMLKPASPPTPIVPDDPVLQELARNPAAAPSLDNARAIAQATKMLHASLGDDTSLMSEFPERGALLDMPALDNLSRQLKQDAFAASQNGSSSTPLLYDLSNAIRSRMRAIGETTTGAGDGPYGQYLDQYSDDAQLKDALEAGRGYLNQDPEVTAATQAAATPQAAEMFKVGAARDLLDDLSGTKTGGFAADKILNSPEAVDKLAATGVDPTALDQLMGRIQAERQMNLLPKALNSAAGGARAAATADADSGVNAVVPWQPYNPTSYLGPLIKTAVGSANLNRNAAVNEALTPMVSTQDPAAQQQVVEGLVANGKYAAAKAAADQARADAAARYFGLQIGYPVAQSIPTDQNTTIPGS